MDASPLDSTVAALESGLTGMTPGAATDTIDQWIETLGGHETLAGIREGLVDLKAALTTSPLDGKAIGALLIGLGARTSAAASVGDPATSAAVARLGGLLESAGHVLAPGASQVS